MDVRKVLDTINEVREWTSRKEELEDRIRDPPRVDRAALRAELEIVRQQLYHYQRLLEDMKRTMTRPACVSFLESV